jgi:serine/threonine protein kinase
MAGLEGTRLGAYELIERIGGGGMAEVYRARQFTAFGREVAIKVIRAGYSEDASFRERFLREAQAISKLSHPNILPLIEFGEENGTLYLVMPLAREGTLRDLLKQRNGPLALEEAIPLFTQLCDAVQYAHEEGIIHRDIKPQNVLLQRRTHVLLADFGIARDTAETQMTTTGAGLGTVEYMAPEQAIGQADKRSDIYSLGVVLYQLLTGTVPYSGSTPFQVLMKHTNDALPDPRLLNPSLPSEIVQVLQGALAKDPQRRFQSAQALARAVQQMRPDAAPGTPQRPGAGQPPISITRPPQSSITKQTTWHGQDFRDMPVEPLPQAFPSGPAPVGPGGITGGPFGGQGAPPPRGWANVPSGGADYDQPTWNTAGGRTAMGGGLQQRGRTGPPPYAGGGGFPPQPTPRRGRRPLIAALIAALVLIVIISSVAIAYGLFGSSPNSQTGQQAIATATPTLQPTDTPTATATPSPTPTDTPTPTPTPSPTPTPTFTPTPTTLPAPVQLSPANGSTFSNYPRTTVLQWQAVPGAVSYSVEVDYYDPGNTSCTGGNVYKNPTGLTTTSYTFDFVGAQPGCWRVWAVDGGGNAGAKSSWWLFIYTV